MKPNRIFLIRHGQSVGNVDKEIYKKVPDYALELTDLGKQQAIDAGRELKEIIGNQSIQFYVSPFWRTRQTYMGIKMAFPFNTWKYYEDPRLREQEWAGSLRKDGYLSELENERDAFGHFYYRFDGGESCADVYDRISSFLNTMYRDFEKEHFAENVIIVTHGMALRVFLMRFFHLSVEMFEELKNPKNCQSVMLKRNDIGKYDLIKGLDLYPTKKHPYQFNWSNF